MQLNQQCDQLGLQFEREKRVGNQGFDGLPARSFHQAQEWLTEIAHAEHAVGTLWREAAAEKDATSHMRTLNNQS